MDSVNGEVRLTCARCLKEFTGGIMDEKVDIELQTCFSNWTERLRKGNWARMIWTWNSFRGDALDAGHVAAEQISLCYTNETAVPGRLQRYLP